ncbi:ankyrin-3-like [Saccostrea cucullata]|uniref:ankyrin-3-like n=1 Tax=Saccostrea cuccullata TaxID=36930 RepID=UPI002ED50743
MATNLDPHTNFSRACRAIVDLNTDILRDELSSHVSPSDIASRATACTKLPKLRPEQWTAINNAATKGSYEDFDSSLLYIMIRNLSSLPPPKLGWNKKPLATDLSVAADVERIHYYRNEVYGHTTRAQISYSEFQVIWLDLEKISERFDKNRPGKNYKKKLVDLSQCCMDEEMRKVMEEKLKSNTLLEEEKKQRHLVDDWKIQDKRFAETRACRAVREELKTKNIVTIVGNSGSGKSFIARHVALEYEADGWHVFPIDYVLEFKRIADPSSPHRQFFVLDDPVGKYYLDEVFFNEWLKIDKSLSKIFVNNNIKVVISCRKSVMCEVTYACTLSSNVVEIDDQNLQLDNEEKKRILQCYVGKDVLGDKEIEVIIGATLLFPLLCRLFTENEYTKSGIQFFQNPTPVVKGEINKYKARKKEKYLALVLLVLYGGTLDIDKFLDLNQSRSKFEEICEVCEVERSISRVVIVNNLDSLVGSFVQKVGSTFSFLHDFLEDVTGFAFGENSPATLLKYCNLKFIRQKVRVITKNDMNIDHSENDFCIILDEKYIDPLVDRFLKEISLNNGVEVCLCLSLRHEKVVKNISNRIDDLAIDDVINVWISYQNQNIILPCLDAVFEEERKCFVNRFGIIEGNSTLSILDLLLMYNHDKICECILKRLRNEKFTLSTIDGRKLFLSSCINGNIELAQRVTFLCGGDILVEHSYDNENFMPLHLSAAFNNVNISNFLLQMKCDVNCHIIGFTALHFAVCNEHYDSAKMLLENKANVNMCSNDSDRTPLFCACEDGFEKIVHLLLQYEADVNICMCDGISPLYIACDYGFSNIVKMLLGKNADVNLCENSGWSPLSIAADKGNISIVEILLKKNADVNICDNTDMSPLLKASINGHADVVQLLLDNKANVNLCDRDGESPLFWASRNGHADVAQLLVENKADVNLCNSNGESPLSWASRNGQTNVLQILLENKADVNLCYKDGLSALSEASKNGHVQLLVENKVNVNLCDSTGRSPLFWASCNGHTNVLQILVENMADVNLCDKDRYSPLHWSTINGHKYIVEILLENKADVNICSSYDDRTPLFCACEDGFEKIVHLLLQYEADVNICMCDGISPLYIACDYGFSNIVKMLLGKNADVNLCENSGWSPLSIAADKGNISIVEILLKKNADVNICDNTGMSPLSKASKNDHADVVQLLLDNKSDVNLCDSNGESPLFWASRNGHADVARLLVVNKADVNLCNSNCESPLFLASSNGHSNIVQILLENKADIRMIKVHF